MRFYRVLLLQASGTLVLPGQSNYIAVVSQPLVVTNTATDSNPSATVTYNLTNYHVRGAVPSDEQWHHYMDARRR